MIKAIGTGKAVRTPSPLELKDLKKRHGLTYESMARPLHGISARRMGDWVTGRRTCPPLAWWALRKLFDGVDIREEVEA